MKASLIGRDSKCLDIGVQAVSAAANVFAEDDHRVHERSVVAESVVSKGHRLERASVWIVHRLRTGCASISRVLPFPVLNGDDQIVLARWQLLRLTFCTSFFWLFREAQLGQWHKCNFLPCGYMPNKRVLVRRTALEGNLSLSILALLIMAIGKIPSPYVFDILRMPHTRPCAQILGWER